MFAGGAKRSSTCWKWGWGVRNGTQQDLNNTVDIAKTAAHTYWLSKRVCVSCEGRLGWGIIRKLVVRKLMRSCKGSVRVKFVRWGLAFLVSEMCSERDSPLKRLYRRTHVKLARLPGSGQLVWAAGCELSLALVHAQRPAWLGETSETTLRVAPPRKTQPPDHTRVNWPVDASALGSAQVGPGGHHRSAARVQVGRELARQKAREGYPSHYTSLLLANC